MLFKNILKSFFLSLLISTIIALLFGGTVYKRVLDFNVNLSEIKIEPMRTVVYDVFGNKMAEFDGQRKEMIPYEDIPTEVIQAVISVEDREFFEHSGINTKAIFRSLLVNLRSGDFTQGGSTITQQLVKEVYLNPGKTLERKQREAIISTILEKGFTKKEIISYYINHNFYGHRAYGIKGAIKTYFGQTLEEFKNDDPEVRVAKAALLAGIPNAPSYFNPYVNPEQTMLRRNIVLTSMYVEGYIDGDLYDKARNLDFLVLDKPDTEPTNENVYYPEYVYYTLTEAAENLELPLEEVMYGGFKIHTSFNPYFYEKLREKMSDSNFYPQNSAATEDIQGASVFLDPKSGQIYAMTGSKAETKDFLVLNRAFQSKRQPGSAMKPIISYGPALETGNYNRYSSIKCQSSFGDYHINDYSCYGYQSMQDAIRISSNATAVWMLNQVGIDYAREYVEKLGVKLSEDDIYLPIALGGLREGVTALELADAYQVYVNNGKRTPAHTIKKITNNENKLIYESPTSEQIIRPDSAEEMFSMLKGVVTSGTGTSARIPGIDVGGKTGTNQLEKGGGNTDLWFVGASDFFVGSVWMGYDQTNTTNNFIRSGQSSALPARLFSEIGKELLNEINTIRNDEFKKDINNDLNLEAYYNEETGRIELYWKESKGLNFEIYRDGEIIGESDSNYYKDSLVEPYHRYTYEIIGYVTKTGKKSIESAEVDIYAN